MSKADVEDPRAADVKKLGELIKGIHIGMLTTADDDGTLHSRPMATQRTEFDGDLWFFTGAHSGKIHEIERDRHVNISYAALDDNRYVSVSGIAQIVRDREKARELWNPLYKAWFPEGLDDPNLRLLRVRVERAEYWESPSSAVVQLAGFVKAMATGTAYDDAGEHQKIAF